MPPSDRWVCLIGAFATGVVTSTGALPDSRPAHAALCGRATAAARNVSGPVETIRNLIRWCGEPSPGERLGPDTAPALLTAAGDNPQRTAGEAPFAVLCGAIPVEASSGKARRRRLHRGGDRSEGRHAPSGDGAKPGRVDQWPSPRRDHASPMCTVRTAHLVGKVTSRCFDRGGHGGVCGFRPPWHVLRDVRYMRSMPVCGYFGALALPTASRHRVHRPVDRPGDPCALAHPRSRV
ncbi:transposase [Streptomyces sp. NPDC005728]|uniref:transposase n=1 Tax=Streptomyces sp. NPDC005728 TaxID=3157054 RepID=UPI0033EE587C